MSNGTYAEFRNALRAFESGWDRARYDAGIIQDWQLDQWAGGPVSDFYAGYSSWADLTDAEWDAMSYMSTNSLGFVGYQFGEALMWFGAKNAVGSAASLALVREIVPVILALTVGAKIATGMTAELGSMKVSEQIDAIASLGADPVKKLVWPRIVAATVALPFLSVLGNIIAMASGGVIADMVFDVPFAYFYETYVTQLTPFDYISGLLKSLVFGVLVGLIGCYQGFETKFGTEAVGISTTKTVVAISIVILFTDFVMTMMFLPV